MRKWKFLNIRRLLAASVAAALVVTAVPAGAVGFRLGAQVAGTSNSLTGDLPDEGSWEGQISFGAGITAELTFRPDVALSFQPSYTPRDCQQVFRKNSRVIATTDYELDYFSLPLLVRVTTDPEGVRWFVTAGLELGIFVDATMTDDLGSTDISDAFDSTTIGALFGAGVMVPVKRHFLTFEFRYDQGLDDILAGEESSTDSGIDSPSVKYRGLGLLVGFLFTLGGE